MTPNQHDALILIDLQNDFCANGALAVKDGEQVIPLANTLMDKFQAIIATQDWHPANHTSFASHHVGKNPFDVMDMDYGPQVLWPDHCVCGTKGADLHNDLNLSPIQMILRKGYNKSIDSYSAFFENDHKTTTGLDGYF